MQHTRGVPYHPMTQGVIERRSLKKRNAQHATVRWQFDISQAHTKLVRHYPD
jgi:hypothetical protein